MQDLLNSKSNDEIDLRELFISLWVYKLFITFSCGLGIVIGGYYALNTEKEFTSTAIFMPRSQSSDSMTFGEAAGPIGTLMGLSGSQIVNAAYTEQVFGRIFIEKMNTILNFQEDPYFNTYDPNSIDPVWKSLIKQAIGWKKPISDVQKIIWQSIIESYSKSILMNFTENNAVKIIVTHKKPERAAEIANAIMDEIISIQRDKVKTENDAQLFFLSNALAKALRDLEETASNLKDFTLKNSALPLENFAAESLQLDVQREQLNRTSDLHEAMAALLVIVQSKTMTNQVYLALRQQFPIIDQVEFRRVLGQNEIINSWSWPKASTLKAVMDTLSERKNRLESQINASKIEAERSSLALETYVKLQREAKIAEATYTVLIEQVKAQSVATGYRPDNTEIYEYAKASISPSTPNMNYILAIGATLGIFLGAALSLILAFRRGVYYSKNALRAAVQADFMASASTLLPLRNKNLSDINKMLLKKPRLTLRDMAIEIHKNGVSQVVFTSSRSKLSSNVAALALASYMQSDNTKVAIIDFSSKTQKLDIDNEHLSIGAFIVYESVGHVSTLMADASLTTMELLARKDFLAQVNTLKSSFDFVFLCADNDDSISLLSALEGKKLYHFTLARRRYTKSATIAKLISYIPIQGLLDD